MDFLVNEKDPHNSNFSNLEIVKNKRVRNELKKIIMNNNIYFEIREFRDKLKIVFLHNNRRILIEFPNDYPFKPPKAYINGYHYAKLLRTELLTKFIKERHGFWCLCCKSILCYNNWHPGIMILDILKETDTYLGYKTQASNLFLASKIEKTRNLPLFCISRFL